MIKHCLIIEDLPATAGWLTQRIAEVFPDCVAKLAASRAAGLRAIRDSQFELALIDLGLPDGSGLDLISALGQQQPDCCRVVTTIYTDDQHLFPALRAGAQGYLLKDQPAEKFAASLQGILAGEPPLSPQIAKRLLGVFAQVADVTDAAETTRLSPRETEVLTLIAKGYRIAEVAQKLGVTRNTAAGFIKSTYRKLNVNSRAEATLEAVRRGMVRTEI